MRHDHCRNKQICSNNAPPKEIHTFEANEEIGTCTNLFRAFGGCFFGWGTPQSASYSRATSHPLSAESPWSGSITRGHVAGRSPAGLGPHPHPALGGAAASGLAAGTARRPRRIWSAQPGVDAFGCTQRPFPPAPPASARRSADRLAPGTTNPAPIAAAAAHARHRDRRHQAGAPDDESAAIRPADSR